MGMGAGSNSAARAAMAATGILSAALLFLHHIRSGWQDDISRLADAGVAFAASLAILAGMTSRARPTMLLAGAALVFTSPLAMANWFSAPTTAFRPLAPLHAAMCLIMGTALLLSARRMPRTALEWPRIKLIVCLSLAISIGHIVLLPALPALERRPGAIGSGSSGASSLQCDRIRDLGFVVPGSRHVVEYAMRNPTPDRWHIPRTRSECQCMTLEKTPAVIEPGQAMVMKVVFVAPKDPVVYDKCIVLMTKSAKPQEIRLQLKANVGLPLEVQPAVVRFDSIAPGREAIAKFLLRNHGKEPIRPLYATSSDAGVIAIVPRIEIPPGGQGEIAVRISAQQSAGAHKARLTLATNCGTQAAVYLEVEYSIGAEQSAGEAAGATIAGGAGFGA